MTKIFISCASRDRSLIDCYREAIKQLEILLLSPPWYVEVNMPEVREPLFVGSVNLFVEIGRRLIATLNAGRTILNSRAESQIDNSMWSPSAFKPLPSASRFEMPMENKELCETLKAVPPWQFVTSTVVYNLATAALASTRWAVAAAVSLLFANLSIFALSYHPSSLKKRRAEEIMAIRKRTIKDVLARFQMEVRRGDLDRMDELCELGGLKSKKELLNNAVTLLEWAVKQKQRGYSVASISPGGEVRELEMPYLENVSRNSWRASGPVHSPDFRLVAGSSDPRSVEEAPAHSDRAPRAAGKRLASHG